MRIHLNGDHIDNLARKLASLGERAGEAVSDMLINGSDYLIDALKRGCAEYGHDSPGNSGRATGGLIKSIQRKSEPKLNNDGGEVVITFKGSKKSGKSGKKSVRYGEIMAYLNYGTSSIPADHWVDNTLELAMPIAKEIMNDTLNKHLNR
ncbi:MAG: hypothetical protein IKS31_04895 [Clostridia bacterium]|nr:hypothetical protein [Clostridia bacterium]